jgi:hypothetical protein
VKAKRHNIRFTIRWAVAFYVMTYYVLKFTLPKVIATWAWYAENARF